VILLGAGGRPEVPVAEGGPVGLSERGGTDGTGSLGSGGFRAASRAEPIRNAVFKLPYHRNKAQISISAIVSEKHSRKRVISRKPFPGIRKPYPIRAAR